MHVEATGFPPIDVVLAQHIKSFLKGLAGPRIVPPTQVPANSPVANTVPNLIGEVGNDDFFCPLLGSVMTSNEHDMITTFWKLKAPVFHGSETEDAYEFILDCYERLHRLDIIHQDGVGFVSFQLQCEAKQWWIAYMKCRASTLPPLTWNQLYVVFLKRYAPRIFRDHKKDEFVAVE